MKIILALVVTFNIFAFDANIKNCFKLFKVQSKTVSFPYNYSNVLKFKSKSSQIRDISKIDDLNLGTYNLENFASQSLRLSKEEILVKTKKIMNAIDSSSLDIVVLQEVLDPKYLVESVKEHLSGKYRVMIVDRPDVFDKIAFLVKKDLPFEFNLRSMHNYKYGDKKVFNKDFPILEILHDNRPIMFYAGLHLKSRFGGRVSNKFFESVRDNQVKSILKIQERITKEYSDAPFVIAGDFNNDILNRPKEFELLQKYMSDSFDLGSTPLKSRLTNISSHRGKRIVSQLDGIFFNKKSISRIKVKEAKVYQHFGDRGFKLRLGDPRVKRGEFPSDHSLLTTTIDFKTLVKGKIFQKQK